MDPVGTIGTIISAIDVLSEVTHGLRSVSRFDRSPEFAQLRREFLEEADAFHHLITSLELFVADYRDQAIIEKETQLRGFVQQCLPLVRAIEGLEPASHEAEELGWATMFAIAGAEWTRARAHFYPMSVIQRLINEVKNDMRKRREAINGWIMDVLSSPVTFGSRPIVVGTENALECTYSTFGNGAVRESQQNSFDDVGALDGWVFYKLFQTWNFCEDAANRDRAQMARMSTLFCDSRDTQSVERLFSWSLGPGSLKDIIGMRIRPTCSFKIWTEDVSGPSSDLGPAALPNGGLLRLTQNVRTLGARWRRTRRLREQSRERRPHRLKDDGPKNPFQPESTTYVLYHAPMALSRVEEDWSVVGAVCPERGRALAIVPSKQHFERNPEDLGILTKGDVFRFGQKWIMELGPFALILQMIRMLTDKDSSETARHAINVYDVERRLRLLVPNEYDRSSNGVDVDFQLVTATLSSAISRLSFHEMRLDGNLNVIRNMLKELPGTFDDSERHGSFYRSAHETEVRIRNCLTDVKFNLKISRVQLQVAYTMISQRDARESVRLTESSIKIAEAAKSDSSIMKMLAVLGAVFLPGTFVSTLFSMTMFNWNAGPDEHILSSYFWVYWAVNVPLTIVVTTFVGWFIATKTSSTHELNRTWSEKPSTKREDKALLLMNKARARRMKWDDEAHRRAANHIEETSSRTTNTRGQASASRAAHYSASVEDV